MSILKTIPIALDLKRVGAQSQALPTLVEGDNGNVFVITMTDDGEPLDLYTATRVICVFSKTSDGKTVEQDTEDANVDLEDYGITPEGTIDLDDTITVTSASGSCTAQVSGTITSATVDAEKFLEKFPDDGVYVFFYNGSSWQYGSHSVAITGDDCNIITVALKAASFGAGTNNCEVQIYSGDNGDVLVTTANFNFKGRKGIMNDETIKSEEKYPILVSLINQVSRVMSASVLSVNGKTGDVVLSSSDVNAVPTTRKVNTKALSADITLSASDIETSTEGVSVQDALGGKQDTISDLETIRSNATNGQTAYTRSTDKVLYLTSVTISAMTGDIATVSDDKITADHVVAEIVFASPTAINGDVTWTTASGSLVLNGKCVSATTANIVLIKKDN